jgi:hypothetical protein
MGVCRHGFNRTNNGACRTTGRRCERCNHQRC